MTPVTPDPSGPSPAGRPVAPPGPGPGTARRRPGLAAAAGTLRAAAGMAAAHARLALGRPVRFAGAWPDRAAALAALPPSGRAGYDDPTLVEVNAEDMAAVHPWDYPVLFWMHRWLAPGARVLDCGGHLATKHRAFAPLLDLSTVAWTVLDTAAVVQAGRAAQSSGRLPATLRFVATPDEAGPVDLLLASGLLQYLDRPLADLVGALPAPPRHVLLNKVALRDGPEVITLERIGPGRVPYRIRHAAALEAEIAAMGYAVRDRWHIPSLAHVVPTHPWLGPSRSVGFALERA